MQEPKQKPDTLRNKYQRTLELSFIFSLLILSSLFFAFQKHQTTFELPLVVIEDPEIIVIPPTAHPEKPKPKPSRPVPAPEDEEDIGLQKDVVFDQLFEHQTDLIPPEPEEDIVYEFFGVQEKPRLKYFEVPKYPELARKAGIEGKVTIKAIISENGTVVSAVFYNGNEIFKDAALAAAEKCIFYPAKQNDKYVKVKMSIPFDFRLN